MARLINQQYEAVPSNECRWSLKKRLRRCDQLVNTTLNVKCIHGVENILFMARMQFFLWIGTAPPIDWYSPPYRLVQRPLSTGTASPYRLVQCPLSTGTAQPIDWYSATYRLVQPPLSTGTAPPVDLYSASYRLEERPLLTGRRNSSTSRVSNFCQTKQNVWHSFYSQWQTQHFNIPSLKCVTITSLPVNVHLIFMYMMFRLCVHATWSCHGDPCWRSSYFVWINVFLSSCVQGYFM